MRKELIQLYEEADSRKDWLVHSIVIAVMDEMRNPVSRHYAYNHPTLSYDSKLADSVIELLPKKYFYRHGRGQIYWRLQSDAITVIEWRDSPFLSKYAAEYASVGGEVVLGEDMIIEGGQFYKIKEL